MKIIRTKIGFLLRLPPSSERIFCNEINMIPHANILYQMTQKNNHLHVMSQGRKWYTVLCLRPEGSLHQDQPGLSRDSLVIVIGGLPEVTPG